MIRILPALLLTITLGCSQKGSEIQTEADSLPSWNEGISKNAIKSFVKGAVTDGSPVFIKEEDRIAVFDNDGTLWSEKPIYFQLYFMIDHIQKLAPEHPEWQEIEPFKSVLEENFPRIASYGKEGLLKLLAASHENYTSEEFQSMVKDWVNKSKHPQTGKKFTEMVYQPMLEVLDLLKQNGFKTYIVSEGGIEFVRPLASMVYNIPPEQVIGSSIKQVLNANDSDELSIQNSQHEKVSYIQEHIGKKPVAVFGNSDDDLDVMLYSDEQEGLNFQLFVHHTDSVREWAYDSVSHVGRLKQGFSRVLDKGWILADIAKDWNIIYPVELELDTAKVIQ
ncbi:HAD family hydrolase [Reichenbachiella versicolor]|uniref:HAD family hydrolase n=1 Tax=Reichenbachiella versicolor TaxID=1821036 RepID=UPI0013A54135|nr:HAD family hydrolase [Reichenbachiella versicolor]